MTRGNSPATESEQNVKGVEEVPTARRCPAVPSPGSDRSGERTCGLTSEGREWEFFRPEGEGRQVEREILKLGLSKWEAGRLADVMDRALERRLLPREVKPLRDGVF